MTDYAMVQRKDTKRKTVVDKILHRKLNIEQHKFHYKTWVNSGSPEGYADLAPLVAPVVLRVTLLINPVISNEWGKDFLLCIAII